MTYAIRTPLVLPLAAVITVGLFLLMRSLIDIGPVVFQDDPPRPPVQINVEADPYDPIHDTEMDIPEPVNPPPAPEFSEIDNAVPDSGDVTRMTPMPPVERGEINIDARPVAADGNPIPVVRLDPAYPERMLRRGVEGQCTMVFDVMPDGSTANVRVLNCTNTGFERSSIQAVEGWRYSPQVRNGRPEVFRGATTQLIYRLDG